jgi:hypothetical protein
VLFTGAITVRQSLWWLACGERIAARVQVLPAIDSAHADRRALAARLRAEIAEALEGAEGAEPAPDHGGLPPGQSGLPPGQSGLPPGQSGLPPAGGR